MKKDKYIIILTRLQLEGLKKKYTTSQFKALLEENKCFYKDFTIESLEVEILAQSYLNTL